MLNKVNVNERTIRLFQFYKQCGLYKTACVVLERDSPGKTQPEFGTWTLKIKGHLPLAFKLNAGISNTETE